MTARRPPDAPALPIEKSMIEACDRDVTPTAARVAAASTARATLPDARHGLWELPCGFARTQMR
jgi:hypothetical protein